MKQLTARATPNHGGFVRTFISPIHQHGDTRFGPLDITMLVMSVFVVLFAARIFVGQ